MDKPVKNFLRKIREEKNLTQDQLVEASGVTRYIISEFENEKRRPSPRTISRLAEALGCSYITLMTGEEGPQEEKKHSIETRDKYLKEAAQLTKKYFSGKKIDDELLMQVSGHLSYIIDEYEAATPQKKKEILKEIKDQKAKFLASEIFLDTKI
jgi:transcriptional regulator with XRE-family HTH domain